MNFKICLLFFIMLLSSVSVYALDVCEDLLTEHEELIFAGRSLPDSWNIASDPEVVKLGDTWYMFFNSIRAPDFKKIHIISASLPKGYGLDSPVSHWKINTAPNGHVVPVISPATDPAAWDFSTAETPKFVYGYDATQQKWVGRLYYTGWKRTKPRRPYHIGFTEWNGERWIKSARNPVFTGSLPWELFDEVTFIGDQTIIYEPGPGPNGEAGAWHLYYNAMTNRPKRSAVIGHATSRDGVQWPLERREILPVESPYPTGHNRSGPYHPDMLKIGGRYYFVGWIANTKDLSKQGLWLTSSRTLDGSAKGDFTFWRPLVYENNGTAWHDSGPEESRIHKTGLFGSTLVQDQGKLWLFYHGYDRNNSKWATGSIGRARLKVGPDHLTRCPD